MSFRFRPLWKFTALILPIFIGCVALGTWQLDRLQWKQALISRVNQNLNEKPVPLDEAMRLGSEQMQYRRIVLSGVFDNAREAYLFGTGAGGASIYHVIAPLRVRDGRVFLVDRGIVPQWKLNPQSRAAGLPKGFRTVVGVWRIPEPPGLFTPAPNLAKRIWYARDVPGIARADRISIAAPAIVEADAAPNPGGWPKGGQTVVGFRNEHLQYAITWFALAAVAFGGWIAFHISCGRLTWQTGAI